MLHSPRATDLGIGTWKGGRLGAPFVIDVKSFTGHFALARVICRTKSLWISMSLCHVSQMISSYAGWTKIQRNSQDGEEPDHIDREGDDDD